MKIENNIKIQPQLVKEHNIQKAKQPSKINSNISYSVYNSTCPIGANYFVPSFGLNNPQAALERSKVLQQKYAQKGLNFLLSNEVWSDKRIFKTLDRVGKSFDELVKKNDLTAKAIGVALAAILPAEISKKIQVKDFPELKKDLLRQGYDPDTVYNIMTTYTGMTATDNNGSIIYLPVERDKVSEQGRADLKGTFQHELKHALTNNCKNIYVNDTFNAKPVPESTLLDEKTFYNDIFMNFEQIFQTLPNGEHVKLNKQSLINFSTNTNTDEMYDNEEQILKDMDKEINKLIQDKINETKSGQYAIPKLLAYNLVSENDLIKYAPNFQLTDEVVNKLCQAKPQNAKLIKNLVKKSQLPDDAFSTKAFWHFMQHRAMDERQAYTTDKALRPLYGTEKEPVDYELQSLMYGEMEKFFRMKAKEAKN